MTLLPFWNALLHFSASDKIPKRSFDVHPRAHCIKEDLGHSRNKINELKASLRSPVTPRRCLHKKGLLGPGDY
jgi:hypothetical protein